MFIYAFIIFCAVFMGFMFFLIKTAPYGYEDKDGMHFFNKLEEMENYVSSLNNENGINQIYQKRKVA